MEVNKKRLQQYIATTCQYYTNKEGVLNECTKDKWQRCHLDDWTKEKICAPDCPHYKDIPLRECNPAVCSFVKKIIKKIQENDSKD